MPVYTRPWRAAVAESSELRHRRSRCRTSRRETFAQVDPSEVVPFGQHDEGVGAGTRVDRIGARIDRRMVGDRRVVGLDHGTEFGEAFDDGDCWRLAQVVGAGLEREPPHGDPLPVE